MAAITNLAARAGKLIRKGFIRGAARPTAQQATLQQIIQPSVRGRWLFTSVSDWTPERIEWTLRNAIAGDLQSVWDLYDLMEATWPRLSKNLRELKDSVIAADWAVQPWTSKGDEPTPEASRRAQAFEAAIWSARGDARKQIADFRGTMDDLLDAWGKGISLVEILWEMRAIPGIGQVMAPRGTVHVQPTYYGYAPGSSELQLNLAAIADAKTARYPSSDARLGWAQVSQDKFILAVAKQKSGEPSGSTLLRPLAWWWCASNFSAQWLLNFAQIFGLPIRWANYDPGSAGLLDQICDMLENMGSAGWGAFPAGTTLELKEPTRGGTGSLPQEAVQDRADRNCDILVLGQTLTTDVAGSGSRALGDVHAQVLSGRKRAAADWLSSIINSQFAPAFCRLNYGDDSETPLFVIEEDEVDETPMEMATRDKTLLEAGFKLPREWAYGRHNVPLPAAGEDTIEKAAPPPMVPGSNQPAPGAQDAEDDTPKEIDAIHARRAQDDLVDVVLQDLTGVQAKWLAGVKPFFARLVHLAESNLVTYAEFEDALIKARRELPELFDKLDHTALAGAMERAMGAGVVNGAARGYMQRRAGRNNSTK